MEIHLLPLFAFLALFLVTSHATLRPEEYWKTVLPNTPMPKAVRDLLHPELRVDKSTSTDVGKGGNRESFGFRDELNYQGGLGNQRDDNPKVAFFFLEKDMHPGATMNLHFIKYLITATLLPRQLAKTAPFSSNKLGEILNRFSMRPESPEADLIKETIKDCETPAIRGEEKYCATSLESMVDFSTSKLRKEVQATSTEVGRETQLQKYTILPGMKKMAGNKAVVCHKQNYPYAVFYCHSTQARAYTVPLEGADGTKAKAVAVCHTDTSAWEEKHLAFRMLKVKPGTVPVCHFLLEDHIVRTPK